MNRVREFGEANISWVFSGIELRVNPGYMGKSRAGVKSVSLGRVDPEGFLRYEGAVSLYSRNNLKGFLPYYMLK